MLRCRTGTLRLKPSSVAATPFHRIHLTSTVLPTTPWFRLQGCRFHSTLATQTSSDAATSPVANIVTQNKEPILDEHGPLHLAAQHGWSDQIEELLAKADPKTGHHSFSVNATTEGKETPLHFAAYSGHLEATRILLERGAHVNAAEKFKNNTALHYAAGAGHHEIVKLLLEKGADLFPQNTEGYRPLHTAMMYGSPESFRAVCAPHRGKPVGDPRHIDQMTTSMNWAPLLVCVKIGHLNYVKYLIEELGAVVDLPSPEQSTALQFAINAEKNDVVLYLLREAKASPTVLNGYSWQAIHMAALKSNEEVLDTLIEVGGKDIVKATNKFKWGTLHCAAQKSSPNIVRKLVRAGCPVDSTSTSNWTPLKVAVQNGNFQVAKAIIELGGDVRNRSPDGWTVLHNVVNAKNDVGLFAADPSRDGEEDSHVTPTPNFGEFDSPVPWNPKGAAMARLLLDQGADVNAATTRGWTALHQAARSGFIDLVEIFLEYGADINSRTGELWTPLHLAVSSTGPFSVVCVKKLLDLGARPDLETSLGHSCLKFARNLKSKETSDQIIKLLQDAIAKASPLSSGERSQQLEDRRHGRKPARFIGTKLKIGTTVRVGGLRKFVPPGRTLPGGAGGYKASLQLLDLHLCSEFRSRTSSNQTRRAEWHLAEWISVSLGSLAPLAATHGLEAQEAELFDQMYLLARAASTKFNIGKTHVLSGSNFLKCMLNLLHEIRNIFDTGMGGFMDPVLELDGRVLLHIEAVPKNANETIQLYRAKRHLSISNGRIQYPDKETYTAEISDKYYFLGRASWQCRWTGAVERLILRGPSRGRLEPTRRDHSQCSVGSSALWVDDDEEMAAPSDSDGKDLFTCEKLSVVELFKNIRDLLRRGLSEKKQERERLIKAESQLSPHREALAPISSSTAIADSQSLFAIAQPESDSL